MTGPSVSESTAVSTKTSIWEDFVDIFFSPSAVFERRRDGRFWPALLLLTVLGGLLFFAMQTALGPVFDAEFDRNMAAAMRNNPQLTEEQVRGMRGMMESFGIVGFVFTFPLMIIIVGLVTWGVSKLFDAKEGLAAAIAVATYAQFPRLLQQVVNILQGFLLPAASLDSMHRVSMSPARFFDPDQSSPVMLALLSRLDLFTIWATILIGIGIAVTGRIPRSRAMIAAVIVWLLGALPPVLGAMRQAG